MPRVVISLVTWNSENDLPACLAAIALQTYSDATLVVVDNASTDGTADVFGKLQTTNYKLQTILNSVNLGYTGAHNQAIRWAVAHGAEFVLVLNPDVVPRPDVVAVMVAAMERHPKAGSIGIPLLRDDSTIDSLGLDVGWGGRFIERGAGVRIQEAPQLPASPAGGRSGTIADEQVLGISGACALYRLAALDEVAYHAEKEKQYFDERFFAYKEDVDLALRLRARGWEAWMTYSSKAFHSRAVADASRGIVALQYRGRGERSKQRSYLSYRNHLFVLKKHWRNIPTSHGQIVVYELGKAAYALVREPWLLKAWYQCWKLEI
ncbi:glycosyltransferase family 2 protein [Candidatus Uhrbacteria bacterium]|nr:glycosyltransferase family 2 protein [Candidatus Uhrbacteria bacterium]